MKTVDEVLCSSLIPRILQKKWDGITIVHL
jgi:hypothetical protein